MLQEIFSKSTCIIITSKGLIITAGEACQIIVCVGIGET